MSPAEHTINGLIEGMELDDRLAFFDRLYDSYPRQLGAIALEKGQQPQVFDSFRYNTVPAENLLNDEQLKTASELRKGMMMLFDVDQRDFTIYRTRDDNGNGSERFTVAYNRGVGLQMGSWQEIFNRKNDAKFTFYTNDGQMHDTRTGMTRDVYNAMMMAYLAEERKRERNTVRLDRLRHPANHFTWLTGDPQHANHGAPCISWNNRLSQVNLSEGEVSSGAQVFFRPAVAIQ